MKDIDIRKSLAISYLACGVSIQDTATALNISVSTIEKWRVGEDFKKLLREAVRVIQDASIAKMSIKLVECADELIRIAISPEVSDRVKISAIQLIFGQLEKARNWELEERLVKIEKLLSDNQITTTET
ncbi:helix-turn-helix domain-containing protein [Tolypothrix sp. VBCCA 56010]|uniref:helix-turn-helix domain-containing protein n=1 Tax=Tolypothrix sp. VBCCA 56010 TaxID=3137731 RepID=UPI003D7C46AF